ncbi:hypothetical protein [Bradyrhizobium iriomotense]|uniref:hypothetical protein n=1 Tax=Bradyrhizobium iriomotense TaxID=441950 RepID=UPI001B89DFDB|nr:hypothetical protein [Bradyrhizobium iriomotense]MBR0782687.1 hypothetical protein [Bradyrhizobium iriomotense]
MRKIILVVAMVLASASAHAGDRSLSLSAAPERTSSPPAAATTTMAQVSDVAPASEAPKYVDRPPAIPAPAVTAPAATTTTSAPVAATKTTARTAKADKPRHKHGWTERRIISELHRHGIYW